jgi:hypothetical protein
MFCAATDPTSSHKIFFTLLGHLDTLLAFLSGWIGGFGI